MHAERIGVKEVGVDLGADDLFPRLTIPVRLVTCPPKDDPIWYIGNHQKRRRAMSRRRYAAEEIINKLHEAEVLQSLGKRITEVVRQLEVSDMTYYKWRREYVGLRVDQAKRLKELEQENGRLRKVVADLTIDNSILKEAVRGNS